MTNDPRFPHDSAASIARTTCYTSSPIVESIPFPSVKWSSDDGQCTKEMERESKRCFANLFYRLFNRYTCDLTDFLWTRPRLEPRARLFGFPRTSGYPREIVPTPSVLFPRQSCYVSRSRLRHFNAAFGSRMLCFTSFFFPFSVCLSVCASLSCCLFREAIQSNAKSFR